MVIWVYNSFMTGCERFIEFVHNRVWLYFYDIKFLITCLQPKEEKPTEKPAEKPFYGKPPAHYFRYRRSPEENNLLEMLKSTEHEECYSRLICTMATGSYLSCYIGSLKRLLFHRKLSHNVFFAFCYWNILHF